MTLGDIKATAYALIDEYAPDEPTFTEDEDLSAKMNLIANISCHELSGIKPIKRITAITRTGRGTTDYERGFELPSGIKKIEQIVAYDETTGKPINPIYEIRYGVAKVVGEVTTYVDMIYINDLTDGNFFIKYQKYPTNITKDTLDTLELELDLDAQMVLPFAIASDILKSDVSADYSIFQRRYEDQLKKLDVRKSKGMIIVDTTNNENEF